MYHSDNKVKGPQKDYPIFNPISDYSASVIGNNNDFRNIYETFPLPLDATSFIPNQRLRDLVRN